MAAARTRRFVVTFGVAAIAISAAFVIKNVTDDEGGGGAAPTSVASTPSTAATSATSTAVEVPAGALGALPRVDLAGYCSRNFDGAAPGQDANGNDACLQPGTTAMVSTVDRDVVCRQQVGPDSRAVSASQCAPARPVETGHPDPARHCTVTFGDTSRAVLQTADQSGWRCAVIQSGTIALVPIDFSAVCREQFGAETYADAVAGGGADAWRCYGAAA